MPLVIEDSKIEYSFVIDFGINLAHSSGVHKVDGLLSLPKRVFLSYSNDQTSDAYKYRKVFVSRSPQVNPNPIDLTNLNFADGSYGSLGTVKGMIACVTWPPGVTDARMYFTGNVTNGYNGIYDLGTSKIYLTPASSVVVLAGWLGGAPSGNNRLIKFERLSGPPTMDTLVIIWGD